MLTVNLHTTAIWFYFYFFRHLFSFLPTVFQPFFFLLLASVASSLPQHKDAAARRNEQEALHMETNSMQIEDHRRLFFFFFFLRSAPGVMRGQVIDCWTQNTADNESFKCSSFCRRLRALQSSFITVRNLLICTLGLFGRKITH